MTIRHSTERDFNRIMEIYCLARKFMAEHGNPNQWGPANWPPEELIHSDREMILDGKECDALFISNLRNRISPRAVTDIVGKYSKYVLGKRISPHKLRAAFCTILYEKTGDIELVRDAVGHRNISTTQRYIVKDNTAKRKSSAIMNSLFA